MRRAALIGLVMPLFLGCDSGPAGMDNGATPEDAVLRQQMTAAGVVPVTSPPVQDPARVALGRALYFDKILSGNRDISCATCHDPAHALGDALPLAVGTGGTGVGANRRPGPGRSFVPRRSPTLLNIGLGLPFVFWDGRLGDRAGHLENYTGVALPPGVTSALAAQPMFPVLNRREMRGEPGDRDGAGQANELAQFGDAESAAIWQAIMRRLVAIPEYVQLFSAAFPGRPTEQLGFQDAAAAIAAYETEAFTRARSPFDRYLEQDNAALNAAEKRGAALFFGVAQCSRCHVGRLLGGQDFANVGVPQIGPGASTQAPMDLGRGELGQSMQAQKFSFRIPPLRNVELTGPYMHDGAYATLESVVDHYDDVASSLRNYDAAQLPPDLRAELHGGSTTVDQILAVLDSRVRPPLRLTPAQKSDLVAFMKALTDPAARELNALTPARVPSGLPVR